MKKGFTFLELMLVIAILGILSTLIMGNFITSLKKGRDARRKIDIEQIQKSLEMYYEDKREYPPTLSFGGNHQIIDSVSRKVYMQKVPDDPTTTKHYFYSTTADDKYTLYSCLENDQDQGAGVKQDGYGGTDCGNCRTGPNASLCRFGVSSGNVSL